RPNAALGRSALSARGYLPHSGFEYLASRTAVGFGAIHRGVGIAQDVVRTLIAGSAEGDTQAQRGVNLGFRQLERRGHAVQDTVRNAGSVVHTVNVFEQ